VNLDYKRDYHAENSLRHHSLFNMECDNSTSQNVLFLLLKKKSPKAKSSNKTSHWKPHFRKWAHPLATRANRRSSHIPTQGFVNKPLRITLRYVSQRPVITKCCSITRIICKVIILKSARPWMTSWSDYGCGFDIGSHIAIVRLPHSRSPIAGFRPNMHLVNLYSRNIARRAQSV
jgi:hypothetical protein